MLDLWYGRVQAALLQCQKAADKRWCAQMEYANQVPSPEGHFAAMQAQRYELAALKEYFRVLEIYRDLLLSEQIPDTRN